MGEVLFEFSHENAGHEALHFHGVSKLLKIGLSLAFSELPVARPAATCQSGPAASKRVLFSDPLVSSPSAWAPPGDSPGTIFVPLYGFFLYALDW
jgi:hypothetical protein